jgi:hypothetical protein
MGRPSNSSPVTNRSMGVFVTAKPQPTLADVMKALDTMNQNIHSLSEQVATLEKNVEAYNYQCSSTIFDYMTSTIPPDFAKTYLWIQQKIVEIIQSLEDMPHFLGR